MKPGLNTCNKARLKTSLAKEKLSRMISRFYLDYQMKMVLDPRKRQKIRKALDNPMTGLIYYELKTKYVYCKINILMGFRV